MRRVGNGDYVKHAYYQPYAHHRDRIAVEVEFIEGVDFVPHPYISEQSVNYTRHASERRAAHDELGEI